MTASTLDVFLHDERIGVLTDVGMGYAALDFTEEALLAHGVGSRALSLSLPFRRETVSGLEARPYFEGLLPEGSARDRIAQVRRISSADSFALLRELGRDCAGALTIQPAGESPASAPGAVQWLTAAELARAIEDLPLAPLGIAASGRVRLSLAGVQDKLVVSVREEDDAIGLPLDGHPSTHILKPPSMQRDRSGKIRFPGIVENEGFCMRLAAAADLPAAVVQLPVIAGERVLLIERFDRASDGGVTRRIHQEDACQALGVEPSHKYEEHGGPSLEAIGTLVREFSATPIPDLYALLDLVAFNALIGNCDAHGKNFSVLHLDHSAIRLAPAYDLVSTAAYPELTPHLAMKIGSAEELVDVTPDALVTAYGVAGIGPSIARRRLAALRERVDVALDGTLEEAGAEGWRTEIVERIADRVRSVVLA